MAGDNDERWLLLVEQVRQAPSPNESPVLPELYTLAMQTGISLLRRKFPGLGEADCEDLVSDKFTRELTAIVRASSPRSFFVTAIIRAVFDAKRRKKTHQKHVGELMLVGADRESTHSDDSRAETLSMLACLESFSDRDQQILRAIAEGEDRETIAQLYDTSRANVDQVLSRARKRWEQWR